MKLLALALMLSSLPSAFAGKILVVDTAPIYNYADYVAFPLVSPAFAVNKEMGRAWVEVQITAGAMTSQSQKYDFRTKVEGLSYDATKNMVVLEHEGKTYECATVKAGGRIFRQDSVKATGECPFKSGYVKVPYDDGYNTGVESRFQVNLIVD